MKDPKRLSEDSQSFERLLLSSGHDEPPPDHLERKIIGALAAVPALAPVPSSKPTLLGAMRPYHLVLVVAAAVAIVGTSFAVRDRSPATPVVVETPSHVPTVAAPPPLVAAPAAAEVVVTPDSLPSAPAAVLPKPIAPVASADKSGSEDVDASLEREVELLAIVKAKLGANNAAEAMTALDQYAAEFPRGALGPEATVLRVRTLLLQGRRSEAQTLADAYLAAHPSSVHAKRIRTLLAE